MIKRAVAFLLLAWLLGFAIFTISPGAAPDDVRTDGIVVPTGAAGRIDRGLALIGRHAADRLLITGVGREVRPVELAVQYGVSPSLFALRVDLGHEAVDTRSNGAETAHWVQANGYRSIRLVTSSWHIPRARMELRHALGPDVTIVSDPVPSSPGLAMLFSEYNKYLIRRVALWLGLDD
ncbi:YdcF family protein [Stakelama saccharophila]|uniref:YdcF family protein n=1 Tax=Stakelama saccharophila TaxID=3075605 RepID=A0ABZ0B8W7_9SPHN|nr:YdcF family protein [Stakelama sp. W311]WNO53734.1 YdcF family protein [Stakelama sp. W311]